MAVAVNKALNYIRRFLYNIHVAFTSINKTEIVWIEIGLFFLLYFFNPGRKRLVFYVRAWTLCCFLSLISTQTFRKAVRAWAHGQLRGDKECLLRGVRITSSGRVLRKVPDSDIQNVDSKTANLFYEINLLLLPLRLGQCWRIKAIIDCCWFFYCFFYISCRTKLT